MPGSAKIKQLQTKLARTAVTEIKALRFLARRVKRVIAPAEMSGRSKTYQGSKLLREKLKI